MIDHLRDPTSETTAAMRPRRAPLESLDGRTVALLDIGKMRGDEFIDRLEQNLLRREIVVRRYRKPTNARVAPAEIIQAIALESHAVVLALSD